MQSAYRDPRVVFGEVFSVGVRTIRLLIESFEAR